MAKQYNIVFDFGGVLFHWHPPSFLARMWPGQDGEASARAFFENYQGAWGEFDQGLITQDEVIARIAAKNGWSEAQVRTIVEAVPAELALKPETATLIEELKAAGHRLFFLSNMPAPLAEHLERSHPLARWFETGVFSSRVQQCKPGREIFATAEATYGVPAASLVLLDDHPANVEAARSFGWQAVLFRDAAQARAELLAQGWALA
ncbi:HAD family hydrolase [Burkholderiaceae bacterium UC74_6]